MSSLIKELQAHLKAAHAYAELSNAKRLKVGSVLVREGRIISVGRNGMPSGGSNECEVEIDGELVTKPDVIHGESNAILFAAKQGISTNESIMVSTHSPCFECSKLLVQSGVKEVYYEKEYRDLSGLQFLKDNNVKVEKL